MALILNFSAKIFNMLVALKDDLKIEIRVSEHRVFIEMPEMLDVIELWNSWIKYEERQAEIFLQSQYVMNPYAVLKNYFQERGWQITNGDKIIQSQ